MVRPSFPCNEKTTLPADLISTAVAGNAVHDQDDLQFMPSDAGSCADTRRWFLLPCWRESAGAIPGLLARLNSTVLSLMDRLGVRNVARQTRYFDAELEQAIQLLLTGRCSVF